MNRRTIFRGLPIGRAALMIGLAGGWQLAGLSQTYREGDIVEDFELVNRRAWTRDNGETVPVGASLRLSDFEGKIVLLEWFAFW